jgi:hypothetical protein
VESLKYVCARTLTTLTYIALFPFARAILMYDAYDRLRWERPREASILRAGRP